MKRLSRVHSLKPKFNQLGDTLIEVLFAMAIAGLIITTAYTDSNRALMTARFSQEHAEALKLAESQIEKLKYIASLGAHATASQKIFATGVGVTTFCIDDSLVKILQAPSAPSGYCALRSGYYNTLITYDDLPALGGTDSFKVEITWDAPHNSKGDVQITYRLHKG